MWPNNYDDSLAEWFNLRKESKQIEDIEDLLHTIHNWWQRVPMVKYSISIDDSENWPLPWDLLAENNFCPLAKCLGIVYTLLLIEHPEIKTIHIVQVNNDILVQINNGEYMLNDQIGSISNTTMDNITTSIDCAYLYNKLH